MQGPTWLQLYSFLHGLKINGNESPLSANGKIFPSGFQTSDNAIVETHSQANLKQRISMPPHASWFKFVSYLPIEANHCVILPSMVQTTNWTRFYSLLFYRSGSGLVYYSGFKHSRMLIYSISHTNDRVSCLENYNECFENIIYMW